ncbi:MAG: methyltransferase domain-containing protein [Chloroflexi bacterium]|nr:methyltransferase domain-containing protein [Chloroflexota bacterium]MBU1751819.1 methyltransferase domain-containing protein [Chloroflexota bacterium]MBU1877755.1 methyltransferase domain-containing protein [Chloroflexota bacterium]
MTTLHLGCGLDYRPGAVNIDRHDRTAADVQADALRLPLADGSVTRVEARQLVEHLGYAGTVYALAEWGRVLAPGGTLLIETPDRPAACRAAAESDAPAPALHWLLGLPWPGYQHRTLFDETDLRALTEQAGLTQVAVTRLPPTQAGEGLGEGLRLTATQPHDPLADLRARLHVGWAAAGIIDPLTAPPHLAHLETVCDRVLRAVTAGDAGLLPVVLGATARHDPCVARVAFQALVAHGFVSPAKTRPYLELVSALADEAFPARLAAWLRANPAPPGVQAVRLRRLHERAGLYLTARLHPDETALHPVRFRFDALALTPTDREIDFFCADTMAHLSHREAARGRRALARGDLPTARRHLETAIAYDADNPLPVWELARLAAARPLEALEHYAALLELLPDAADALRTELDAVTGRAAAVGPQPRV